MMQPASEAAYCVTLALVGDVMLGRMVHRAMDDTAPESFWGSARPVLSAADAVFANLESAITTHRRRWSRTSKTFHFGGDGRAIDVLKAGNIRYVNLANNHTLDFEETGLLDTIKHLDAAGIAHAGAGRNLAEAHAPAQMRVGPLSIAVLSLTDNEPAFAARNDRPGTAYGAIGTDPSLLSRLAKDVERIRVAGADLVVLSLHWGPNMVAAPPARFRRFAHGAVDAGVDLIHGHSAHIFQAIERRGRGLILYDTGDFLDDYAIDPELRNDWSFIFLIDIDRAGLCRLRLRPVKLSFCQVDLATASEADAICTRMERLCRPFGADLQRAPDGLQLDLHTRDSAGDTGPRRSDSPACL
jgi:poly-gamma-glutamate capsule biosynthesis protein CapA/YwtB (metallophosphatase superfamily)